MPHEPTISAEQRAEWKSVCAECSDPYGFQPTLYKKERGAVLAVDGRLAFLEADHARLVEENRRLREALHTQQRFVDHWNECEDCLAAMEPCFVAAELDGQATELRRAALASPEDPKELTQ